MASASSICVLCYNERKSIDFAALAHSLRACVHCNDGDSCTTAAHYDDLFVCDMPKIRLGIAHCALPDHLAHSTDMAGYSECLMIVISSKPGEVFTGPDVEERHRMCAILADRVERLAPADEALLVELPAAFTSEVYDQLHENLWPALARGDDAAEEIEFFLDKVA